MIARGMLLVAIAATAFAAAAEPEYSADVPAAVTTPDKLKTRLGALKFTGGLPTEETAALAYDTLDLMRGIQVFTDGLQVAST